MSKSKIELWVDDTDTEFAILLNSKVVSKTSENVKITKKVDHAYYLVGPDIDWKYTIDQWITFYLSNKYASLFASTTDSKSEKRKLPENEFIPSPKLKLKQTSGVGCIGASCSSGAGGVGGVGGSNFGLAGSATGGSACQSDTGGTSSACTSGNGGTATGGLAGAGGVGGTGVGGAGGQGGLATAGSAGADG